MTGARTGRAPRSDDVDRGRRAFVVGTERALGGVVDELSALDIVGLEAVAADGRFTSETALRLARDGLVDRVVIASETHEVRDLVRFGQACAFVGCEAYVVSSRFATLSRRWRLQRLGGVPVYRIRSAPNRGAGTAAKRVVDVVGSALGLMMLAPLFLGIAAAVKLTSAGPILHRQVRIGKHGRRFTFYKFRSMRIGTGDDTHRAYVREFVTGRPPAVSDTEGRDVYKLVDDPRVTAVGRFIRRTSLDELPQLLNVLRGEMSLVGPRPCLPYEFELYDPWQTRRTDVVPGCTGLWQVVGRSHVGFEEMILLDLHYISNWSLWSDLRLIARTIPVMVSARGGH